MERRRRELKMKSNTQREEERREQASNDTPCFLYKGVRTHLSSSSWLANGREKSIRWKRHSLQTCVAVTYSQSSCSQNVLRSRRGRGRGSRKRVEKKQQDQELLTTRRA